MVQSVTKVRADIQALRGLAVLAVVFYHAKIGAINGGYLGVDIFFVLSGFLITSLIKKAVEDDSFSYKSFLARRAKRLLPAAFVTFLFTSLAAPFLLGAQELADFWHQLFGALTFSANFVLTSQSGYFSGAAELKPLLHVWSLAVEEQYYFILPAIFLFFPRKAWLPVLTLLTLASMVLCYVHRGEASTFFLLPTRAWELLIGSLGVFLIEIRWIRILAGKLAILSALGLLACLILTFYSFHPGPQALLICLGTLAVILANHPLLQRGVIVETLHKVGDISYSLYLVHWPIFAFYNNIVLGNENTLTQYLIRAALIILSFLLAWILHRHIEEPFRHGNLHGYYRPAVAATCVTLMALGIAQAVITKKPEKDYAFARRANTGFAPACASATHFLPSESCQNSETPTVLVWGDSFAMHLVPGLSHESIYPKHIVQATMGRCGPLIGLASVEFNSEQWAKKCIEFNDTVLSYLKKNPELRTVILSSPLTQYTRNTTVIERVALGDEPARVTGTLPRGHAGLARTVSAIRALGRDVILVAPPPSSGFDIGRCLERRDRGQWIGGVDEQCRIKREQYLQHGHNVLALLDRAEKEMKLPIVRFDAILCDDRFCRTRIDGVTLYRDEGHLSYEGSIALFGLAETQLQLRRAIQRSAELSSQTAKRSKTIDASLPPRSL